MISYFVQLFKSLSRVERAFAIAGTVVFATSFTFWAIAFFYSHSEVSPVAGGTFTEGVIGQPVAVNPLIAASDVDGDLIELTFANVTDLVETVETGKDNASWVFNLKQDLRWSDGAPITSDDVVFTIETIQDPDARSPLFATWQGVVAERLSERQFRLSLKTPYAFFQDNLERLKIVPRHIFGEIPPANLRLSAFNLEPVGSGPYAFSGFDKRRDGFITDYYLARNPHYAGEKPYIDAFRFAFFSTKEDVVNAFNRRTIDGLGGLDSRDLSDLKINHRAFELNIPSYYAIFFNQSFSQALREDAVREALTLATDKKRIIETVFNNHALTVDGPLPPYIAGYAPSLYQEETFSIEKASLLLDKAGWRGNEEGVREKTLSGTKTALAFEIVVPEVEFLTKTIEIIQEDWAKIGVTLTLILLHPQDVTTNVIKSRNYQMLIFGTILRTNPDIFSFWHSSERFYPGSNLALFNERRADQLLESIKFTLDEAGRTEDLVTLQELILTERPAIFLYSPIYFYVTTKKLSGFQESFIATRSERLANVEEWYLKTKRSF